MMAKKRKKQKRSGDTKVMLSEFLDRWEDDRAAAAKGGGSDLDDGRVIIKPVAMEFKKSQKDNFGLNTKFEVMEGDNKGRNVWRWDNIDEERGLQNVIQHLTVYGVDLDDIEPDDLPALCESIVKDGPSVVADLVTKNDFQNVRVIKLAEVDDDDSDDDDDADNDEDETTVFDKGDDVEIKVGRKWIEGTVKSYDEDEDTYYIRAGKPKKTHKDVDSSKVRPVEEPEDEDDDGGDEDESDVLEKGTKVEFTAKLEGDKRTKKHVGTIRACSEDGVCKIKIDGKKKLLELPSDSLTTVEPDDDDDEDDDDTEESPAPVKGDIVICEIKGKEREAEVLKSSKKNKTCVVKVGKKEKTFDFDDVEVQFDENDDD